MENRNAIVTGARRGIGREVVEVLAATGMNVWACARCKDEAFEADMRALSEKYNVWIKTVYFDLADENEVKSKIQEILKEKQTVDVLVNNAGVSYGGTMVMTPISKLKEVFDVNFHAQIQIMQLVARTMMRQKSGVIINVASVGGIETAPGYLAYGASKAALIYATKTISHELGEYNIRVNAIAPGLTDTDMGHYKSDAEMQIIIDRSSLHRVAEPREIANCIAFLASDSASFITGQVMVADGGRLWV